MAGQRAEVYRRATRQIEVKRLAVEQIIISDISHQISAFLRQSRRNKFIFHFILIVDVDVEKRKRSDKTDAHHKNNHEHFNESKALARIFPPLASLAPSGNFKFFSPRLIRLERRISYQIFVSKINKFFRRYLL